MIKIPGKKHMPRALREWKGRPVFLECVEHRRMVMGVKLREMTKARADHIGLLVVLVCVFT